MEAEKKKKDLVITSKRLSDVTLKVADARLGKLPGGLEVEQHREKQEGRGMQHLTWRKERDALVRAWRTHYPSVTPVGTTQVKKKERVSEGGKRSKRPIKGKRTGSGKLPGSKKVAYTLPRKV